MHGSSALFTNNANNLKPSTMNYIKNLILEFLRFQGEDPTCWDYRANQFFSYHNTPEHQKVIMALYHLGGEALIWFQDFEQAGRSLLKLFKLVLVLQPMMIPWRHLSLDSNKLQLWFLTKVIFEILSNRIMGFSESHKLSCFLSGLKDEIRLLVRMLMPKSLSEAFGLAKI